MWYNCYFYFLLFAGGASGFKSYISDEEPNSDEDGVGNGSAETTCPCGWTNKARVVGGKETKKNEYPLILALVDVKLGKPFCGASILTKRHGLTAAHCTEPTKRRRLAVIAGAHDLYSSDKNDPAKAVIVKETIEHGEYNKKTFENDIAILILEKDLEFSQIIGPVCLPSESTDLLNKYIKLLGWGKVTDGGPTSDVLLKVNLRVIELEHCHEKYNEFNPIDIVNKKQICAFRRNRDSCQGDSGGPLIWLDPMTNRYTQVALVSFGAECASEDKPSVNTNVHYFVDWIKKTIQDSGIKEEVCQRK